MRIKNMFVVCPFVFTVIVIGLSGCEKNAAYTHPDVEKEQAVLVPYEKIQQANSLYLENKASVVPTDETLGENRKRKTTEIVPVTDPSMCKNNSEGYIYFKVGEETFRFTKKSPIHIGSVIAGNLKDVATLKGCKENPYMNEEFSLVYDYKADEDPVKKIKFYHFKLESVPLNGRSVSGWKQDFQEKQFETFKASSAACTEIFVGGERCTWESENKNIPQEKWSRVYKINRVDSLDRPLIFNCIGGAMLECETVYRLYPSVNFIYSYFPEKNKIDEKNIGLLDKYLRQQFESMNFRK